MTATATSVELKTGAPKLLLGIDEAAAAIGVSRAYLYRDLIGKGLITPVHIGRSTKIPTTEIERFVNTLLAEQQQHDSA